MIIEKDVKSSAISHIKYDTDSQVLSVTFTNDATYDYYAVPHDEVEKLAVAESVGKYFNKNIKQYSIKA